jgi:transposase InsO family protein
VKRDYISVMPRPDARTAVQNLAMAFEHYNEWHPHSALESDIYLPPLSGADVHLNQPIRLSL